MSTPTANSFESQLQSQVRGEVCFDEMTRGIYSTDASHYQIRPSVVVVPLDEEDTITAVKLACEFKVPVTARGGGTSLSGQTTWTGMILDLSKHLNKVLEVNASEQWVRVQPGIVRDELNAQLASQQLHFAPDPATGNRAAVGGMVGNNTSGTHSIVYGKTIDNIRECKVVVGDGTVLHFGPRNPDSWHAVEQQDTREAEIYRGVRRIFEENVEEIQQRYPKVMRRVSGYNLDAFLPEEQGGQPGDWNLAHLIVGSEGTLGVLLEATLHLEPIPKATALCIIQFHDLIEATEAVDPILEFEPSAIELLDRIVIAEALVNPATAPMADFLDPSSKAVLIVEVFGETREDARQQIDRVAQSMQERGIGFAWPIRTETEEKRRVWEVRKLGLGLIANSPGARKGQAFIEDACVPTAVLPEYTRRVFEICENHGVPITVYAHASVGVLHYRPMLDLHEKADVLRMRAIAQEVFQLVKEYGGSWSGEHGDGLVRGEFIPQFFGPKIYGSFRDVKRLFDPHGIMNPGKIVDTPQMTDHLRYGEDYQTKPIDTAYHYRDQGGFRLAVEQCAGVGACRKTGSGTMCPSYMALRDEEHSTRGRANALRLAISGQLGPDALTSDRMHDVLTLCLSCKACKTECPTAVDMSRLKSEVQHMRHRQKGTPFADRLLGRVPQAAARFSGALAPLANFVQRLSLIRWILERMAGVDRRRPLPAFHSRPFARDVDCKVPPAIPDKSTHTQVALFIDTFTNYYEPHVGAAAMKLLKACGYDVIPAIVGCCQRPQISRGLLTEARRDGLRTMQALDEFAKRGIPILVLEPSCASALVDDLGDLLDDAELGQRVAKHVKMIDVFLAEESQNGRLDVELEAHCGKLLIHGHCHQKAMFGTQSMKDLLQRIPGLSFEEVDSGCCGMAGSFGYENYDLSKKIGEDRLFPALRKLDPETEVVACGISCRHQMHDFLNIHAKHWVEVVGVRKS